MRRSQKEKIELAVTIILVLLLMWLLWAVPATEAARFVLSLL
jgi:hypothetical protein